MHEEEEPPKGSVVEEFSRLVDRHLQFHLLVSEERRLQGMQDDQDPSRCKLPLSDAQLQDGGVTAATQLEQLLLQLQEGNASALSCETTLHSIEALATLHFSVVVDVARLTFVPPEGDGRSLLALPLSVLGRLATVGVVSWPTVITCLSSDPGSMKTLLQEVMRIITVPPEESSSSTSRGVSPRDSDIVPLPTSRADVVAASQLCLALMAAAFSSNGTPSRTQNFAKKVLQVLTFKIVKYLLKVSAHLQAPLSEMVSSVAASSSAIPAVLSSAASAVSAPAASAALTVSAATTSPEAHWGCCALLKFYDCLLDGGGQVGQRCVVEFFTFHLRLAVTCDPAVQLSHVLQNQHLYRTTALHPLLRGVLKRVCCALGWEPVLQLLDSTLRHQEVSWSVVLPLVATVVSLSEDAALKVQELVAGYLRDGCANEDQELCMLGLVVARQCCEEGPHAFFPRYPHWFTATFGSSASSPATNKKEFTFLMKVLSALVPHERALQLRTHSTQGVAVPRGCQSILRDYQTLARTRLRDISGDCPSAPQAQQEVQSAVQQFLQFGQLPRIVLEMNIFRRGYFISVFLPALLSHRTRQGHQDLIDALSASGHLPPSLLSQCTEAPAGTGASLSCTPVSAQEELRLLLQRVAAAAGHQPDPSDGGAEGVQSALSNAAASVEKLLQADDAAVAHDTALCADDIQCLRKPRALQALRLVLECVEAVVGAEKTTVEEPVVGAEKTVDQPLGGRRPAWLSQLVALLAVSPALQGALLAHAVCLVTEGKNLAGFTSAAELLVMGAVLCEVSLLDGLFMNVFTTTSSISDGNEDTSTISLPRYLLQCIAPSTPSASWAAARMLSGWLSWRAVCSDTQTKSSDDVDLDVKSCAIVSDGADEVSSVYWCVLWRLEELQHLLPSSFDISGLATAPASARPSLAAWLQFALRCGGELSHASHSRSLQRLINQHFPASDGRTVLSVALRVLLDVTFLKQEDRLCLLSLLQHLTARLNTPLAESILSCYNDATRKSPVRHDHFLQLLQDVPPAVVVGGLTGSEVLELLLPLIQEMRTKSPTVHLSSEVTSCLLNALLLVRSPPLIADSALNQLWHSVAFHWSSVRWVLEENLHVSKGNAVVFPSIQELWSELGPLPIDDQECSHANNLPVTVERVSRLRPQLAVHYLVGASLRCLRLHSEEAPKLQVHCFSGLIRKMYVKVLASFVGEQIFYHRLSYFSEQDENKNTNEVLTFQERLLKHSTKMLKEEMTEDIFYFLECISSTTLNDIGESYCLFGFIRISLCCLESTDIVKLNDLFRCRILHIIISCHSAFTKHFDKYDSLYEDTSEEPPLKKLKLSVDSTADYPSQLCEKIVRHVSTAGQPCLRLLLPVLPDKVDDAIKTLIEKISSQPLSATTSVI